MKLFKATPAKALAAAIPTALALTMSIVPAHADNITIHVSGDNSTATQATLTAMATAFEKANPTVTVVVDSRPAGTDGDNFTKTSLSTGTADDVIEYNSGSLLQALNPTSTLTDISGVKAIENEVIPSFNKAVSVGTHIYGAPFGSTMGGGILYNKAVFKKAGIKSVPVTWAQFMADSALIKKIGVAPVIQTFKDTWTSQLFFLGDFFNVAAAEPTFAAKYTANKAKFATDKVASEGFFDAAAVFKAGYLNKDFASADNNTGLKELATGTGAMYPMLTFVAPTLDSQFPGASTNIGFFGIPGSTAKSNGITVWEPAALYIPKTTQNLATAEAFVAFFNSPAGLDVQNTVNPPSGPYAVKGAVLPNNVDQVTKDMQSYFNKPNATYPALEFLSPVKGPNLENITVEIGDGQVTPQKGAALYDQDVKAEAQQLNLPGW